jgi:heme/copper-type cytochrome/quinol oxidase subunit 3
MEKNRLGMLLFIGSESVFFALLIVAFVVYHRDAGNAAEAAEMLDRSKTAVMTAFLLSSSATAWLANRLLRAGNKRAAMAFLGVTIALGATFIVGQGREYAHLISENVTISRDLFGTTFFTLTGFHGLHVIVGLVMMAILLIMGAAWRGSEPRAEAMESISLYWHFVDAVWLVIFPTVYIYGVL